MIEIERNTSHRSCQRIGNWNIYNVKNYLPICLPDLRDEKTNTERNKMSLSSVDESVIEIYIML